MNKFLWLNRRISSEWVNRAHMWQVFRVVKNIFSNDNTWDIPKDSYISKGVKHSMKLINDM